MKHIGIRELKSKASSLVRQVEESGAIYTITRHGRAVGQLAPPAYVPPPLETRTDQAWARFLDVMESIRTGSKTSRRSALAELTKMRR